MDRQTEIFVKIIRLKRKLDESDYIASKLSEAIAISTVEDNNERMIAVYNEYKDLIYQRQAWRDEINALESEMKSIKQK